MWSTVLEYEQQLRRAAVRLVNYDGMTLAAAMEHARRDVELRSKYFLTPTLATLVASSPPSADSSGSSSWQRVGPYDFPSGKGKGKKGKGKAKGKTWHTVAHDGRAICFAYNALHERCRGACSRVHCCQICLGSHPAHAHHQHAGKGDKGSEKSDKED